jgi:hypothetical protein
MYSWLHQYLQARSQTHVQSLYVWGKVSERNGQAAIVQSLQRLATGWTAGDPIQVLVTFPALVQTGPRAHPASHTMGTESLQGLKRPGRGVDHPPTSSAEVKERVELHFYSSSAPSRQITGWISPFCFLRSGQHAATGWRVAQLTMGLHVAWEPMIHNHCHKYRH